jgi:hypothetical protein
MSPPGFADGLKRNAFETAAIVARDARAGECLFSGSGAAFGQVVPRDHRFAFDLEAARVQEVTMKRST